MAHVHIEDDEHQHSPARPIRVRQLPRDPITAAPIGYFEADT